MLTHFYQVDIYLHNNINNINTMTELVETMEALKLSELYCSEKEGSDESGAGTKENPLKTILQAMKVAGKEPFPSIFVDSKVEGAVV